MKKLVALLLACMMLLTAGMAMAEYTSVKVENSEGENITSYPHTLQLTGGISGLDYEIEYTFALQENSLIIMQPSDIVNAQLAVSGNPVISTTTIKYDSTDVFSTENKSRTKDFVVDWSNVDFKEPGVYRWTVNKSVTDTDPTANTPSNCASTFYLYVYVIENSGALKVQATNFTSRKDLDEAGDGEQAVKGEFIDQYPSTPVNLTIEKTVAGNQGSRDQYFAFHVTLKSPAQSTEKEYTIAYTDGEDTWNGVYKETAYNSSGTNPTSVKVSSTASDFVLYLKHGQSATIQDLPFNTYYNVTEDRSGYSAVVNVSTNGDNSGVTTKENEETDQYEVEDNGLTNNTVLTFVNTKTAVVPTGIDLQTGAPIMGLLLAAAMLLMLNIGKRKEAAE